MCVRQSVQWSSHHPDRLAGAHVVIVGVPALELWVLSALQNVLLALKVGMVVTDPSAALHTDGVHPVHEATVLEVIAVSVHLQLPAREASSLIKHYLKGRSSRKDWLNSQEWTEIM